MTDKLHCCFCGEELNQWGGSEYLMSCTAECTRGVIDKKLWKLAIEGKKAQDALKVAKQNIEKWYNAFKDMPQYGAFCLEFKNALDEISSITK